MRASEALVIEAKKSWQRLQQAKEFFFADLEEQMKENHRRFLDMLMLEERQRFLQAHPYQRHEGRVDQANGFYRRSLTTVWACCPCRCRGVARERSGRRCCRATNGVKRWWMKRCAECSCAE